MRNSRWLRLLAYVTGSVNQELLLRNEYLAAENRILRAQLPSRCGSQTRSELRLRRSESVWDAERFGRLVVLPSQTRSWLGIESS
jgi:hypothetical protein